MGDRSVQMHFRPLLQVQLLWHGPNYSVAISDKLTFAVLCVEVKTEQKESQNPQLEAMTSLATGMERKSLEKWTGLRITLRHEAGV